MTTTAQIQELIEKGAIFFINDSGGKDSQCMRILLERLVPAGQLEIIHADLPGMDWEGIPEHINKYTALPLHIVRANKTFFDMVRARGYWPAPKYRQCTSDLKRGPIEKKIRERMKARGAKLAVNCTGLRAAESCQRSQAQPFKLNKKLSAAGRTVWEWLPIHDLSTIEVFATISAAGQEAHPAYAAGMTRLSCKICIMSSEKDIKTSAALNPDFIEEIAAIEREIGQTFFMPTKKHGLRWIKEICYGEKQLQEPIPPKKRPSKPVQLNLFLSAN